MRGAIGILHLIAANIGVSMPAPHAGERYLLAAFLPHAFQSPLPIKGVMKGMLLNGSFQSLFQSPLPVRGAIVRLKRRKIVTSISIPAPREGSDAARISSATECGISIPAPREGSDSPQPLFGYQGTHFNPRSP